MGRTQERFRTPNMWLAAYLLLEGFRHLDIVMADGNQHAEFVFEGGDEIDQAVDEFEIGTAVVEPRGYMKSVSFARKRLRNRMESARL